MKLHFLLFALLLSPVFAQTKYANVFDEETETFFPYAAQRLNDIDGYITRQENLEFSFYGGWKAAEQRRATGFFRVEKIDGRWWAIDPEGYLYFHKAVNSVQLNADITADDVYETLPLFGINGTGSFSDEEALDSSLRTTVPLAHCPRTNFARSYSFVRPDRLPIAIFDDEFVAHSVERAEYFRQFKDDPQVFGYFTDNELSWTFSGGIQSHIDVDDPADKNYQRAVQYLATVGKTVNSNITEADEDAYASIMAERYFSVVTTAIRNVDPNHMILGPRLNKSWNRPQAFHEAAGRYLDIVALNHYHRWGTRGNELENIAQWTDRPLMLTEFYAMEKIPGVFEVGAGWKVETQADRVLFNEHFTATQIAKPFMVGMHWFNLQDDAPIGSDPGVLRGILDVDGDPHEELRASMKYMNDRIYDYIQFVDGQTGPDLTIAAEADAYFRGSENNGTATALNVRLANDNFLRSSYLRFDVSAVNRTVKSAKIKLFSISPEEKLTGTFHANFVANDSWSETGITRNNAPAPTTRLLDFSHGDDLEIDVTDHVNAAASGDNKVSIAIISETIDILLEYGSREHPDGYAHPKLVITYDPCPAAATSYAEWLDSHPNVVDTGFMDDGDGDGQALILEYVFGADPEASAIIHPVEMAVNGDTATITFERNPASTCETEQILQYGRDVADIENWTDLSTNTDLAPEISFGATVDGMQTVHVSINTSTLDPGDRLLARLKIQDRR